MGVVTFVRMILFVASLPASLDAAAMASAHMSDAPPASLNVTRNTLAAGFRMLDMLGHSDLAAGFLIARHPERAGAFLTHEHGLHWDEVQPADFFSVDVESKPAACQHGQPARAPARCCNLLALPDLPKAEEEYHAGSHDGWPGNYTGALEWLGCSIDRREAAGAMPAIHRLHE